MQTYKVTKGCYYVEVPEAGLFLLCGCPENSIKFLIKQGLIHDCVKDGVHYESGPNAILLSEIPVQNGNFSNLAEFPVLQMLYRQGMILPGHPNNTGARPMLIGPRNQIEAQSRYIYLGNYGVTSVEELRKTGVTDEDARDIARMKLWFAFGKYRTTEELLDLRIVDKDATHLRDGVIVRRKGLNVYEILFHGESTIVDLNLGPQEQYGAPYSLGHHDFVRQDFSVVHIGEGDGWDIRRPCMGSIITCKGRVYLIDAGPNIRETLSSLGIGVSDVSGIFHTHAHDDHFVGLTTLLGSDHRMAYYASPLVRRVATEKLCALTAQPAKYFDEYFEVHDLTPGQWNEVAGMEVLPVESPHPVETTVFFFRVLDGDAYKTYAHLADLSSFNVLDKMICDDPEKPGVARERIEQVKRSYLTGVNRKKIDIGGGMIHGSAKDFAADPSDRIYLSHNSSEPSAEERKFGSVAVFGQADVLVPAREDYLRSVGLHFLRDYFPIAAEEELSVLLESPRVCLEPGETIAAAGDTVEYLYLILGGFLDSVEFDRKRVAALGAGTLVGELECLTGARALATVRAASVVTALRIRSSVYVDFVERSSFREKLMESREIRRFLASTPLFGDMISGSCLARISARTVAFEYVDRQPVIQDARPALYVVANGELRVFSAGRRIDTARPGDFYGEEQVLYEGSAVIEARATMPTLLYRIRGEALRGKPAILFRLHETLDRRLTQARNVFLIEWRPDYSVKVNVLDEQHSTLFSKIRAVQECFAQVPARDELRARLDDLLAFSRQHFDSEEGLMREYSYSGLPTQKQEHESFFSQIESYEARLVDHDQDLMAELIEFCKDWLLRHTLHEDRKYSGHFNSCGVF